MVRVKVVAVILSAFFILSEAAVTLEVISGLSKDNTTECGQSGVLRCVVSPFPGTTGYMAWNTDSESLTQCYDGSDDDCSSLSVDHYQFSSKLSDETFNLTFNTVKLSDSSVEFRCTDSITTASVTPNVAVVPDNASTLSSSSGLELKVTTGCVYPVSAVTFKWYYVNNGLPVVFDSSESVETNDSTGCTTGDCGGSDVKKITSKLTTDSEGEEYNIYVDVIHNDVPENDPNYVVSKSFGRFKVKKATTASGDTGGLSTKAIAGIVTAVVVVVVVGILVVVKLARLGKLPCYGDTSKDNVGTRSSSKKDEEKLLDTKKQSKIPGKVEGVNKKKHVIQNHHQELDNKIHRENEGKKPGRDLPQPPVGANHSSQLTNIQSPGHDSKGRGLSANFGDDDRPSVAIDIPAQKAGTLPMITDTHREDKKSTKKMKKDKQEDKSFLDI